MQLGVILQRASMKQRCRFFSCRIHVATVLFQDSREKCHLHFFSLVDLFSRTDLNLNRQFRYYQHPCICGSFR